MKKIVGLFAAAFVFAGFPAVISCSLTQSESDDEGIKAPTVAADGDTVIISASAIKNSILEDNILYANIIREQCSDNKFSSDVVAMNIGQVNRTEATTDFDSFIFIDKYTNGYFYRYYVRYYDSSAKVYLYSDKSESISGNSGQEANLTPTDTTFYYDYTCNNQTETYTLTSDADVTVPGTDFSEVDIVLSNGTAVKPFKLSALASGVTTVPASSLTELYRILPAAFLDVELTIKGIIGIAHSSEATETSRFDYYYWSNLAPAKVKIYEMDVNGDTLQDGTISEKMTVPSTPEPTNGFDYSLSVRSSVSDVQMVTLSSGVELDLSL